MDVDQHAASVSPGAETSAKGAEQSGAADQANTTTIVSASAQDVASAGTSGGEAQEEEGEDDAEEEEYEIEAILKHDVDYFTGGGMAYLVSWVGYGPEENCWVPEANAENAEEMLAEYWRRHKTTPKIRHVSKTAERVWREHQEALSKSSSSGALRDRGAGGGGTKRDRDTGLPPGSSKKFKHGRPRARLADDDSDDSEDGDADLTLLSAPEREAILKKRARRTYERLADWEKVVKQISNVERHPDGRLIVFVRFEDGTLLAFDAAVIHHRCPQKLISFYESRLRFRPAIRGGVEATNEQSSGNGKGNGQDNGVDENASHASPVADATNGLSLTTPDAESSAVDDRLQTQTDSTSLAGDGATSPVRTAMNEDNVAPLEGADRVLADAHQSEGPLVSAS